MLHKIIDTIVLRNIKQKKLINLILNWAIYFNLKTIYYFHYKEFLFNNIKSISLAASSLNKSSANISKAIKSKSRIAYGFRWILKSEIDTVNILEISNKYTYDKNLLSNKKFKRISFCWMYV